MSRICNAAELATSLSQGEPAIFPTDTLPALSSRPEAAMLLWELKARPREKPVILMGANGDELLACLGVAIKPQWRAMAKRHWPGEITLVLPAAGTVLDQLNPGGTSLGLRVPACEQALELLRISGPLATTSTNHSGQAPCLTAAEAAERFPHVAQLGPLPWPQPSGQGSTVVEWKPPDSWILLRQGAVLPEELKPGGS